MIEFNLMEQERGQNFESKSAGILAQTWLLTKKNLKTKMREEKRKLLGEVAVPITYLIILSLIVSMIRGLNYEPSLTSFETPQNVFHSLPNSGSLKVYIIPDSIEEVKLAQMMNNIWNESLGNLSFTYLKSEKELLELYASSDVQIALVKTRPGEYKIRLSPDGIPAPDPKKDKIGLETCRSLKEKIKGLENPATCPVNSYYYKNFLLLQSLLSQAQLRLKNPTNIGTFNIVIENYPKAKYTGVFMTVLRIMLPICSVIPLAQILNNLLVLIVTEKEDKIKDGLRMVGITDTAYWLSWFIVYGAIVTILAILFTIVIHIGKILVFFSPVLTLVLFVLFGFSVVTFAFLLTPFFHNPKTAGIIGTFVLQFSSFLFLLPVLTDGSSSDSYLIPLRFISSLAFAIGLDEAATYEDQGGIGLSDLGFSGKGSQILFAILFLLGDTIGYALLAVYLDNVIPNKFGVRKHVLFFLNPKFWIGQKQPKKESRAHLLDTDGSLDEEIGEIGQVEQPPVEFIGKENIRIRHISKIYKQFRQPTVEAIKDLSLNIYGSEITAIIGRNGSGKSTLIGILTGLVNSTKGTASLFGYNIEDSYGMQKIREVTGVCLQYDLHFKALTVKEHFVFYGKLRGLTKSEMESEIAELSHELELSEKLDVRSDKLSGGQKRKLSVGLALIGNPKIILLDEPSAGVDPVSRRHLWSLLQKRKEGRVILLTTHFMDEADLLADRKAIIHDGTLKCMGSSLFLKNKYGVGYHLTIELNEDIQVEKPDEAKPDDIVVKWIPDGLKLKRSIGTEIIYTLPLAEVTKFKDLFADLENEIAKGGRIKSFGVSMTTLEEIFLKISSEDPNHPNEGMGDKTDEEEQNLIRDFEPNVPSQLDVYFALVKLRLIRVLRSPMALFFMLFLPIGFIAYGLTVLTRNTHDSSTVTLNISNYNAIYPDLNIALYETNVTSTDSAKFLAFLRSRGFTIFPWNGIYKDLLTIRKDGTMSALSLNALSTDKILYDIKVNVNGTFVHSPAIIINAIYEFTQSIASNEGISTLFQPFDTKEQKFNSNSYAAFLLGPAYIFSVISMVIEIVYDKEIKAKGLLRVNGMKLLPYYLSMFTVFGIFLILTIGVVIGFIPLFNVQDFMGSSALWTIGIISSLYILPALLCGAVASYAFDRMETAQAIFSQVAVWSGTLFFIPIIVLEVAGYTKTSLILHCIFSFVDVFYIPYGLFYWTSQQYLMCILGGECGISGYLSTQFLVMYFALIVQIPVFILLLIIVDVKSEGGSISQVFNTLFKLKRRGSGIKDSNQTNTSDIELDEDVLKEKHHVNQLLAREISNEKTVIAVKNLAKSFKLKVGKNKESKKEVLKGISFAVEEGQVFGLLGHNGAGKTTAMKIIIAEVPPDSGKVDLCGYDISSNMSDAFRHLGYCPQHDALWPNIKLIEHIQLYATIRGIPKSNSKNLVNHFLSGLKIVEHGSKTAEKLSGGTKRKLSYCLSMLGAPKIVLLDEPSTGMDPQSKRFLWNTVLGSFKDSRGAILTTHSMEEADALCSKIAIMVKGKLLCIGSSQHLKSKFGQGYTLEVKLKWNSSNTFDVITKGFPGSELKETFSNRGIFSLPKSSVESIALIFNQLEELKKREEIEEYSFSQTTLEQVFLSFEILEETEE